MRRLADDVRPPLHQSAEVEPLHADVTPDEERGVERLPQPACEPDRDRDTERAQQSDRIGEELPADRIEDDVDRLDLGQPLVGHRLPRAERERELELLSRAGRRDDLGAELARDDDRRGADATCGRVDENPRAGMNHHLPRQRDPGRQIRHQERGALLERRPVRQVEEPLLVERRDFSA